MIEDGRHDARVATVAAFVTRCRQASPDLTPRPGADSRPLAPSRPVQTPVTINGRAALDAGVRTHAHPPVHGGDSEPIEFVPAIGESAEAIPFEPPDDTPAPGQALADAPVEEMNSVLDMELFVSMVHQQQRPFVVHTDKRPLMLVDPVGRSYRLLPIPDPGAATPEPPPIGDVVARLRRGSLRYRDARAADPPPGAGVPIELLLWNLGMVLQPDDLLPQVKARGWVKLTRWPNFGRIRSEHAQLKMSALLTSRAVGVDDVFEALGEPRPIVIAFLNACALCGLLADAPVDAPPPVARVAREGRPLGGLMQRLRGALGIGRA